MMGPHTSQHTSSGNKDIFLYNHTIVTDNKINRNSLLSSYPQSIFKFLQMSKKITAGLFESGFNQEPTHCIWL